MLLCLLSERSFRTTHRGARRRDRAKARFPAALVCVDGNLRVSRAMSYLYQQLPHAPRAGSRSGSEREKEKERNARRGGEGEEKESPYRLLPHRGTNGRVLAFPPAELLLLRPLRRFPHRAAGVGRLCDREIPHGRARWRSQGGLLRDRSPPLSSPERSPTSLRRFV